jgi:hypothetical protein
VWPARMDGATPRLEYCYGKLTPIKYSRGC